MSLSNDAIAQLQKLVVKEAATVPKPRNFDPTVKKAPESVPTFTLDDDGEEYQGIGLNGVVAASEKLLAINRGLAEPDERDSMQYQKVHRTHALIRERIKMDSGKTARTLMYQAAKHKSLKHMAPGIFNSYINAVMVGNPLTSPLEEINPMQLAENARRITSMGPGGLGSSDSITEEAQSIHSSQFGFIDNSAGPECLVSDAKHGQCRILTSSGWIPISELQPKHRVACFRHKRLEFNNPNKVVHEAYKGTVYTFTGSSIRFTVTPQHRVAIADKTSKDGQRIVLAEDLYEQMQQGADIQIPGISVNFDIRNFAVTKEDDFTGMVHCASVPGGMIFVSYDGGPGFVTGNSEKAGIDVRISNGVHIGSNGRLYQKFFSRSKNRYVWLCPADLSGHTVRLPD